MSVPTLADLLASKTKDEWTAIALAQLQNKNFPTTDWTSTSPERAMVETSTACDADLDSLIPQIVALALLYYAQANSPPSSPAPASLQFVAFYWYGITAFQPTATVGAATLTCNSLAGPYTITAGQLIATDNAGHTYTNTTGGALGTASTLDLTWQAQVTGSASNVLNNTITTLVTPLPGVSINNPGPTFSAVTHTGSGTGTVTPSGSTPVDNSWLVRIDTTGNAGVATWSYSTNGGGSFASAGSATSVTPGGSGTTITLSGAFVANDRYTFTAPGSWITTQGTNLETTGSLVTRCLARWPSLSETPTLDVYTKWALESDSGITRVLVENSSTLNNVVDLYCAGPSGPISTAQQNKAQAYIDVRAPFDVPVVNIAGTTSVTVTGDATYPAGASSIPADRDAAISEYVNSVGLDPDNLKIKIAEITALALNLNAAGVPTGATNIINVEINGVASDLTLSAHNVASPVIVSINCTEG
jgi:hypothetical protein